jgi:two-component system, sensor histidine kinase and response regulator
VEALRILVVDDEPGMRLGVERALRNGSVAVPEAGGAVVMEVSQAADGREALASIEQAAPDILLLDHKLPDMTGLDVLERVAGKLDVLTIMITAYASLETAVTATKRGAFDFLAKPFTPAELRAAVQKAARHLIVRRQARQFAEERQRVRFQFLSVLAHELKAPLAAIEGYLHIMRDRSAGAEPAVYDQMVDRCLFRAEGMRKLILDLLDLTRIESGLKKRELADVDFAAALRHAAETVMPEAARRNIAVAIHCPDSLPMRADRGELEIILNNLLSNAVKYNRVGGRVDASATADGETLALEVADTGIGLSGEEIERLFQDFVRIRNERTREILGSGLGLSIVKKLAGLYGGDASVKSEAGKGSTFRVTLRRHPKETDEREGNPRLAAGN